MKTLISFQNKMIPVYISPTVQTKSNALPILIATLNKKITSGKRALQTCLKSLISIEIVGSEAILHTRREIDSLAISLY
ncbi:hypothetical protein NV379_20375 [Paenibacillus sp. N1-5-1-14]|uniref:hypothetical protein n=1 Tax=Paenibacillus radicibacter TaxID=2972488 RepID=UPI002158D5C9|nr:hypothetical protein [Paenibacillus radicibacter]MCR8645014.1 hypothetical protein [Paenibacillus radicibacter]